MWEAIKQVLKKLVIEKPPKKRPIVTDGSYPSSPRMRDEMYERDRDYWRRHDESYMNPGRGYRHREPVDEEKQGEQEPEKQEESEKVEKEKPDWKIRDEQYERDREHDRRHQENFWETVEKQSAERSEIRGDNQNSPTEEPKSEEK